METAEYARRFEIEDTHWYFVAKRRILGSVIDRLDLPPDARILDVGCGTGGALPFLAGYGRPYGVDVAAAAVTRAARRGHGGLARGDLLRGLPFRDGVFDLALAMDVLEHVDDDIGALTEIQRVLRPGGRAIVTAPAFMSLWGPHDVAAHHCRRYRLPEMVARAEAAGLEMERATYFNTFLFPITALFRAWRRFRANGAPPRTDLAYDVPAPIARALQTVFGSEARLLAASNLPFGVSVLAVARRGNGGRGGRP